MLGVRPQDLITPLHPFFPSLFHKRTGEITPQMVAWLSSIKEKNLNNCGKFVLTGDMSELSITKVDLSNMNTLEGMLSCCPKATRKASPQIFSLFLRMKLTSIKFNISSQPPFYQILR